MVADAVHSLSDFLTDIVVLMFVHVSGKPKDKSHDYGHGKYETLAMTIIGVALLAVAIGILYSGITKIVAWVNGEQLAAPDILALWAALLSIILKEGVYRYSIYKARQLNSPAVEANAWHHRSDALSSIGTAIGIGGAIFLGHRWAVLDPVASVIVGLFIVKVSVELLRNGIGDLMEQSLPDAVEGLKPTYVYPDYLSFEHHPQTVFEGANQYRRFNISNFYFQSENLAHIRQTDESFEIDIATCESRARKAYASYEDIHGEKFVYVENEELDNATEADYCRVNFFYKSEAPLTHEDLYIMGALNDWCFNESNKMTYDYRLRGYTCSMMLKQGYYNFMFVTLDQTTGEVMTDLTAGNHWETNNVYKLYFYYYNAIKGYDELIGYSTVNSH